MNTNNPKDSTINLDHDHEQKVTGLVVSIIQYAIHIESSTKSVVL